jgi:V8-like Glu-specific endopeptidase
MDETNFRLKQGVNMKLRAGLAICVMLLGSVAAVGSAWAQGRILTAEAPFRVISRANSTTGTNDAFSMLAADRSQLVRVPGAEWLQLQFSNFNLGWSTLRIRDLDTGELQTFTQAQLEAWEGRTAMFNSSRLRISIDRVQNERQRVFYQLEQIRVGESINSNTDTDVVIQTICGTDNRVASTERRVGRLVPVGCTAWIVGNNLFLTAGHCVASRATTLQFNVPASQTSGALVAPATRDQYAVVQSSIVSRNSGIGNDWALFRVAANTQTGLLPRQAQGSQFSLANNRTPTNARITGFGTDTGVTNQTNQIHTGPFGSFSGTSARYSVDTTGGNSGSPVASAATGVAIAIHTNGGCTASGGANSGTSFRNTTLWNAIRNTGDPGLILNP